AQVAHDNPEGAFRPGGIEANLPLDRAAHLAERLANGARNRLRARCGRHTVAGAHEQRILEDLPQAVELLADGGLGEMQVRGRDRHAARLKNRVEYPQKIQIQAIEAHEISTPSDSECYRRSGPAALQTNPRCPGTRGGRGA